MAVLAGGARGDEKIDVGTQCFGMQRPPDEKIDVGTQCFGMQRPPVRSPGKS